MSRVVVLDSSAFLAFAKNELGSEKVKPVVKQSVISSVNYSEILLKLVRGGIQLDKAENHVRQFVGEIVDFDQAQARIAIELDAISVSLGLSLADRACLALASLRKLPVMTADSAWSKIQSDIFIEQIREKPKP